MMEHQPVGDRFGRNGPLLSTRDDDDDGHGRRSSVNFRGKDVFAGKICMKN